MPLILDDLAIAMGVPFLISAGRAAWRVWRERFGEPIGPAGGSSIAACRASVPVEPGLKPTSSMLGGHMYSGSDPTHVAYLHADLDHLASQATPADARKILAFKALQGREGSTAAVNTYDNQIFTWGTGWGGLGGLGRVMDRLRGNQLVHDRLLACGVEYLGQGNWLVYDSSGQPVTGKKEALQVIRQTPELLNLFIDLAKSPETRDAVTDAQLGAFTDSSASLPGSDAIATQALFNFAAHLKHWAPGYMLGTIESAAQAVPGAPSAERDRALAREIVRGFYGRAIGWIPAWKQMQQYALRDMKEDGLDVSGDPTFTAAEPPARGASGCGNYGSFADTCGAWGNWSESFDVADPMNQPPVHLFRAVNGPGGEQVPPGFEHAREVLEEPEEYAYAVDVNGQPGEWLGEVDDDHRGVSGPAEPTQKQIDVVKRGVVQAVEEGDFDPPRWTQISVGDYEIMVMNEPLSVRGLRLPTSFDDAVRVGHLLGAIPITPAVSDARWAKAKRVYARPLNDATGALMNDPSQVVRYNAIIGPNAGDFVDGYWKEVVLVPGLQPKGRGSMAQYGFKLENSMFEHGGPSNHDKYWKDYSDTPTYMSRTALRRDSDGDVEVDLVDVLRDNSALGGALPAWLLDRLRSGEVGA